MPPRPSAAASLLAIVWSAPLACAPRHGQMPAHSDLPGQHRLSGEVLTIDSTARNLTLLDAGKIYTVTYDEATVIRRGSTELPPDALRKGDRLIVSLRDGRTGQAEIIGVAGPGPAVAIPRGPTP